MNNRSVNLLSVALAVIPCALFAGRLKPEVERAMAYGAEAKICLKVHDDIGQPVSNASVAVVFDMLPSPHSVLRATQEVRCAVCRVCEMMKQETHKMNSFPHKEKVANV